MNWFRNRFQKIFCRLVSLTLIAMSRAGETEIYVKELYIYVCARICTRNTLYDLVIPSNFQLAICRLPFKRYEWFLCAVTITECYSRYPYLLNIYRLAHNLVTLA